MELKPWRSPVVPVSVVADEGGNAMKLPGLVGPLLGVAVGHEQGGGAVGDPADEHPLLRGPVAGVVDGRTCGKLRKIELRTKITRSHTNLFQTVV